MATAELPKLLFVAAEPAELSGILRRCGRVRRLNWPVWYARAGELNGVRTVLVANGPGSKLAAEAVRAAVERARPEAVVSTGYCGALDPEIGPGEVFVASRVESGGSTYAGLPPQIHGRSFRSGTLVSVDRAAGTAGEKARLRAHGASAVDMEAGAVAYEACRNRLRFYCIRAVTDLATEGFVLDFNALRDAEGRLSRVRIVKAALARPMAGVPELLKLQRRAASASRALGDFIGTCEF